MVKKRKGKATLTRQDWVDAARRKLVASGVSSIKIDGLARELGATRGSFYWHFADHADLLNILLTCWAEQSNAPFRRVLDRDQEKPLVQILRYCEVWLDSGAFDPTYDSTMRDWGRISPVVAETIRLADEERIDILVSIFCRIGYDELEALIRSRALYYHQIGYYAMKVDQPLEERLNLLPTYFRVLTGMPLPPGETRIDSAN